MRKPPLTAPAQAPEPSPQERAASVRLGRVSSRIAELERWEAFLNTNRKTFKNELHKLEQELNADENSHPHRQRPIQMRISVCQSTLDAIENGVDPRGLAGGDYASLAKAAGFGDVSQRPSLRLTQRKLEEAREELAEIEGVIGTTAPTKKLVYRHTTEIKMARRRKTTNGRRGPR